jgi:hypothetical protein
MPIIANLDSQGVALVADQLRAKPVEHTLESRVSWYRNPGIAGE